MIVTILGATASGKTKLSLALAKKFDAEIISADSMQLYRGLDIATAKATPEELKAAKHHLIDFLDPSNEAFTVQEFKQRSLNIIKDLQERNKMTIIVGGTNYYIESLLWNFTVDSNGNTSPPKYSKTESSETTVELYNKLKSLDKESAEKLHPNNRRKILTALRHVECGEVTLSQELTKQHNLIQEDASLVQIRGGLRFPNCIGLMIDCSPSVLEARIKNRVDKMISEGLLQELEEFHNKFYASREKKDFKTGIFQVLGLKEFEKYFALPEDDRSSKAGLKIYQGSLELLKQRSVRYSKQQLKWINKRILRESDPESRLKVYRLDSSDLENWSENVNDKAMEIVESLVSGTECKHQPIENLFEPSKDPHKRFICDVCDGMVLIGETCYHAHLNGKGHKAMLKRKKMRAAIHDEGKFYSNENVLPS